VAKPAQKKKAVLVISAELHEEVKRFAIKHGFQVSGVAERIVRSGLKDFAIEMDKVQKGK
jgi:hypothetical protein